MSEYLLFLSSAAVSGIVNFFGRFQTSKSQRILVVKLDHLGDVILATPALRWLHESFPGAQIDILLAPDSLVAMDGSPSVGRILFYDSSRYRRARRRASDERGPVAMLREVARGGYSTIVELRGDWWTLLLPFLTGARRRSDRGSVRLRDWIARRVSGPSPQRISLHEVETNLAVVQSIVGREIPERPCLEFLPSLKAHESMLRKLQAAGLDFSVPIVCLHPGAAWRPRAWRPERFAVVADWIQEHYHAQVAFVGSAEEHDIEDAVRAHSAGRRAYWLSGVLTLRELGAFMPSARLFIGNDSGPAHLAAACGVPSVILFGPQDPSRFRPWSDRSIVLHHRVHCFPCRQTVCVHPENPCVNLIDIAEVQAKVREALGPPESFR